MERIAGVEDYQVALAIVENVNSGIACTERGSALLAYTNWDRL